MKRVLRSLSTLLMSIMLVVAMIPVLGLQSYALSETITGAPSDLTVSTPAEGETQVTVSWTPDLESGIDRDSSLIVAYSDDNMSTWTEAKVISFSAGTADIKFNSYAAVSTCTVPDLKYGKSYYFKAYYIDKEAQEGPDSNIVGPIECKEKVVVTPEPEDSGSSESGSGDSGSGGAGSGSDSSGSTPGGSGSDSGSSSPVPGGSGGSSGNSSSVPSVDAFEIINFTDVPGEVRIHVSSTDDTAAYIEIQQLKPVEKTLLNEKFGYYYYKDVYASIGYKGGGSFRYRIYYQNGGSTDWQTFSVKSSELGKTSLAVTKISSSKAALTWTAVPGATGYKIYCKNKAVKTVGAVTAYTYSKKGAGTAKYKVAPIIKSFGKTYTGPASAQKKGGANMRTYSPNKSTKSVRYGNAPFRISKISLSGSTYTITGYVVNNRMFNLKSYKKLNVKITLNGKKVASKTLKNLKSAKCKRYGTKKVTIKIKGKAGVDVRNGDIQYSTDTMPNWEVVGTSRFD